MNQEEQAKRMQKVIARAWSDEAFKERLLANPAAFLKEEGVEMPAGVDVRVVENTESVHYLVLPSRPPSRELSYADMEAASGGSTAYEIRIHNKSGNPAEIEIFQKNPTGDL